ncbi:MAG: ABC transporter substrate-binding protein [Rhodovibrionaceae bacterium]
MTAGRKGAVAAALCLLLLAAVGAPAAGAAPQRVVSLNLCTDELLLLLAGRERIAAVSALADDPVYSPATELAEGLPETHGTAEEVLRLAPDLVLASRYSPSFTLELLRGQGIPVVLVEQPDSLADSRQNLRQVAKALGMEAEGETLLADFDARLRDAAAKAENLPGRRGLVLQARGYTHGAGSLIGELLALAGIENIAAELGYRGWAQIPLETLLRQQPEVIVVESQGQGDRSLAAAVLRHPALNSLDAEIVAVPERLWACGSPFLAESLERIVDGLLRGGAAKP